MLLKRTHTHTHIAFPHPIMVDVLRHVLIKECRIDSLSIDSIDAPEGNRDKLYIMEKLKLMIASINQRAVFQKSWKFSNTQEAKKFLESQKHVFQLLQSKQSFIQESKEYGFCCDANDQSVVKVCFEPLGERVGIKTANDLLTAVLSISRAVFVLHSDGIVHNDLRWLS